LRSGRPLWRRAWFITLVALALTAGAARAALNPVARHLTHRALGSMEGYQGDFDDVSISLLHLRYRIIGLSLSRNPGRGHTEVLKVKAMEARLDWRGLWRRRFSGVLRIEGAKATYDIESRAQLHAAIVGAEAFANLPDLGGALEGLVPLRVNRVEVRDSEVLVIDRTEKGLPDASRELWLHGVEATVENVGSRSALLHGEPATLAVEGKLQRSGEISVFMTLDPLAYKLDFEGEVAVRHLRLEELYGFMVGLTALQTKRGTLDAFATFRCYDGSMSGALKPILSNLELAPTTSNLGNRALAAAGNAAIGIASHDHELATVIPFGGRVTDPQAHVWPALRTLLERPTAAQARKDYEALPVGANAQAEARPNDVAEAHHREPGRPPLSVSPQGVFERGAVATIQAALSAQDLVSPATGTLEGVTQRQVLAFQERQDLPGTGFPDRETLRELGLDASVLYRAHDD
jgi:hypothetical protein